MKFYLGVTDNNWYRYLSAINPEDVNFWQPGGKTPFKVLEPGAPFLFKLKSPLNVIGGVGFFSGHTFLPLNMAWDTFNDRNGTESYEKLRRMILNYRTDKWNENPSIGCIVLTNPIFFAEEDWIQTPDSWGKSIVQGKSYSTAEPDGKAIWDQVELRLQKYMLTSDPKPNQLSIEAPTHPGYREVLSKVRIGQGAFRVMITDAYSRKCAISGERTLPVLEAAHIKPYSESGPHMISNGMLMRSDIHKLFDTGYITITTDHKIEVSSKIREEFENGKDYYKHHGKELFIVPGLLKDKPGKEWLEWHNGRFKG